MSLKNKIVVWIGVVTVLQFVKIGYVKAIVGRCWRAYSLYCAVKAELLLGHWLLGKILTNSKSKAWPTSSVLTLLGLSISTST